MRTRWAATSRSIDDACGLLGSHLVVLAGRRSVPDFRFSRGLFHGEPMGEAEELYVREYGFRDERLPRLRDLPAARLVHNREIYTVRGAQNLGRLLQLPAPGRFQQPVERAS